MGTPYETDVAAWANEQVALLRSGNLTDIDALNIAEEIEGVAKSERRELKNRMTVLVAHLLKWQFQPDHRGKSWRGTVHLQRGEIRELLDDSPSLKHLFEDERWLKGLWRSATAQAQADTMLNFPATWTWALDDVLDDDFWPD